MNYRIRITPEKLKSNGRIFSDSETITNEIEMMTKEETSSSRFSSSYSPHPPPPMTFLSSGYSTQSSLSPVSGRSVHLSHQFSSSLFRHGFYQDNTLTAATKSKERHLLHLKKNRQSMVSLSYSSSSDFSCRID